MNGTLPEYGLTMAQRVCFTHLAAEAAALEALATSAGMPARDLLYAHDQRIIRSGQARAYVRATLGIG